MEKKICSTANDVRLSLWYAVDNGIHKRINQHVVGSVPNVQFRQKVMNRLARIIRIIR